MTIAYEDYVKELGVKGEEIAHKYVDVSDEEVHKIVENKNKFFKEHVSTRGVKNMEHIRPKEIIVWEDAEIGVKSAKNANM